MKKMILSLALILLTCLCSQAQDAAMKQYAGVYIFDAAVMEATVSVKDGKLFIKLPAGTFTLTRTAADRFSINNGSGWAKFQRDKADKVTALSLFINGSTQEGRKEEEPKLNGPSAFIHYPLKPFKFI